MSKICLGCMETFESEYEICPHCGYAEGTPVDEAVHMKPGTMLSDRYIVGKVLGFGGFGITYIGWDRKLEQKVAIKEYLPTEFSTRMSGKTDVTVFGGDKSEQFFDGMNKFVEEAKRLAKFKSELNIVRIFDCITENGTAYIIMEYLDGETLTERLKREKTIPESEAIAILKPVMRSLITVHEEGILHRDIAPDNIFLTKSGEVKLIDFGASRYATTSHSKSLTVIIKPGYSAEEQYRSRGEQGPHTDVYSLAATMYKMITGKTPPDAMERRAMIETRKKEMLCDPHKYCENISKNTENAILNAMNIQIEDRTPDVRTFLSELESENPVKRRYGKIKKIDLYSWPLWLKILIPTLIAASLVFVILTATDIISFPSLFSDNMVIPEGIAVVPDIEGTDKDEAVEAIMNARLVPSLEGNVESEFIEAGKIVLQTPNGGAYLEENGIVSLTVSSGKTITEVIDGKATVPYVIWDTLENAVMKLKQAGLSEPLIEMREDDNAAEGMVISQSVKYGTQLDEGSQITVVVSSGPKAFDIPNVIGKDVKNAKSELEAMGLAVTLEYKKTDEIEHGKVLDQSISTGTKAKKGDKVVLIVASGIDTVNVANTVGQKRQGAESTLKAQGFTVNVLENYDNTVEKGYVISQAPNAGSSQVKGTSVTICVSKGKQPIKISFDANGGSVKQNDKIVYFDEAYGDLPTANRKGYTFTGWFTSSSGGNEIKETTKVSFVSGFTLYAHWKAISLSVKFDANGGTVDVEKKTVNYGEEYGDLPFASREGYDFIGWFTSARKGDQITNLSCVTVTSDQTLYAHWESDPVTVTKVSLNKTALSLNIGGSETLAVTVYPDNATNKALIWSSSDADVVSVNSSGTVSAHSVGTATITAISADGNKKADCTVTVIGNGNENSGTVTTVEVTGITLDKSSINLAVGESDILKYTVCPDNATNKSVIWSTSDPDIAFVNTNGVVMAYSAGTATITVYASDHSASCTVYVNENVYKVILNANGGSVSTESLDIAVGSSYGTLPTPTRDGFSFDGWYTSADGGTKVNSDETVVSDCTLYAHWKLKFHTPDLFANVSGDYIKLSWVTDPGIMEIDIYRSEGNSSDFILYCCLINRKSYYDDDDVKDGVTYYYKIKAKSGDSESEFSNIVSAKVEKKISLTAPEIKSVSAQDSSSIKVRWYSTEGAETYSVYRSLKKSSGYEFIASTNGLSYTDTGLSPGTKYYYKITACAGSDESDFSDYDYDTTDEENTKVSASGIRIMADHFGLELCGRDGGNPGGSLYFLGEVLPTEATDKKVTWSISDTSIAKISNISMLDKGSYITVDLLKTGIVTLKATTSDGAYTASCIIDVY